MKLKFKLIITAVIALLLIGVFVVGSKPGKKEPEIFGMVHVKGSGINTVYSTIRDSSYFKAMDVDGNQLVQNVHYTVEAGSRDVTFYADYLDNLTAGNHTLTVLFRDGVIETTEFKIEK